MHHGYLREQRYLLLKLHVYFKLPFKGLQNGGTVTTNNYYICYLKQFDIVLLSQKYNIRVA